MRTYSRACKNKKTESKGEEVFFIEKAFKSSIEIPSSTDKGTINYNYTYLMFDLNKIVMSYVYQSF